MQVLFFLLFSVINSRPRNLTVVVNGDSNLTVSWQPLTPAELSYREHSYKVFYKKIKEQTWNVADVAPNTTSITLRSLSGYTTYGIRVLVNTAEGNGISSAAKEIRTMEGGGYTAYPNAAAKTYKSKVSGIFGRGVADIFFLVFNKIFVPLLLNSYDKK